MNDRAGAMLTRREREILDRVIKRVDYDADRWLREMGEYNDDENGTEAMANKWSNDLSGVGVADWYRRPDVSRAMVRELAAWHVGDPNVWRQNAAIIAYAQGPRVLDYGGGIGTLAVALALARPELQVDILEPGPWCRSFAAHRASMMGANIRIVKNVMARQEYNTIIAMDVIEHLPRPAAFLDMAKLNLAEGGIVAINWIFHRDEGHPQHIAECTPEAVAFHKRLKVLFGPKLEEAAVTQNGWPSIHQRKGEND